MKRFWAQAGRITLRDLLIEGRAGEGLAIILPFGVLALLVIPLATDASATLLSNLAAPIFWLITLVFGIQIAFRQSAAETATQRRMLTMLGLDPVARFVGRSLSSGIILLIFLLVLFPIMLALFQPEVEVGLLRVLPDTLLYVSGLAMLGTLIGDISSGLRNRTALAPLLSAPLAIPLVMGASQAMLGSGQEDGILTWTILLGLSNLLIAVVSVLTARTLEEAAL